MALLSFPTSPTDGDLYPVAPLPGQNQYQWEQATLTWRLLGAATAVAPGTYGNADNVPQFTVDATGKITFAADIPIGQYYVKTNNPGAFNNYFWPNGDGLAGEFLTTDGAGNLSWSSLGFINYWQLLGNIILPATDGRDLALTDSSGNIVFYADNTGSLELTSGTTAIELKPVASPGVSTLSSSGGGNVADPLRLQGSNFTVASYGNSFLNTPGEVDFTQSALDAKVPVTTTGSITVNSGTANSFATPPTRGTVGQFLQTNGDGTTSWVANPALNYWTLSGSTLSPANNGENITLYDLASIPRVELQSNGNAAFTSGTTVFNIEPGFAAGTTGLRGTTTLPGSGISSLQLQGTDLTLDAFGAAYTNEKYSLSLTNSLFALNAKVGALPRGNIFEVDNTTGTLKTGLYLGTNLPSFQVVGSTGNTTIAGTLTINQGLSAPPSINSYTFPSTRGVSGYVLQTNADGTTAWVPAPTATLATRTIASVTTSALNAGQSENVSFSAGFKTYTLLKVQTDAAAAVVLYNSVASRTADAGRDPLTTTPGINTGIIGQWKTTGIGTGGIIQVTPGVIGWNDDAIPTTTIYARVVNNDTSVKTITVQITILKMES